MGQFIFEGKAIHFIEEGKGEVIVLLPGNTASSAVHAEEIEYFSRNYRLICPDYTGYGQSERLECFPRDFLWQNARMVKALMAHLNVSRYVAMGTSGGGIVALSAAILDPELVAAVVADSIPGERFSEQEAAMLVEDRKLKTENQKMFWGMAHGDDWESVVDKDTRMILDLVDSEENLYKGRLGEVKCPVLITGSLQDEALIEIQRSNLEIIDQLKDVRTYYHPEGWHPLMWSQPEVFRNRADTFLIQVSHERRRKRK